MKNIPNVSVIIPLYNNEKFLVHCVKSIIEQTYKDFEVIIYDDGSKDNSLAVAKDLAKIDERIRVFSRENKGPAATRNDALSIARGKYISFIDSDDYVSKWFLEMLITAIQKDNADIAVVKDVRCSEKQRKKFKRVFNAQKYKCCRYDKVCAMQQLFSGKRFGLGPCNKLFKAEIFKGEKGVKFPEDIYYSEDVPFVYDAFVRAEKVVYLPEKSYAYTRRKGSQVRSKITPKKTTSIKAVKYCAKQCYVDLPKAYPYVAGWRLLANFEMLFYMFRDSYFDYELYLEIKSVLKNDMHNLTKSKKFPLYRRKLLPFASWLLKKLYNLKFRKQLKEKLK